MICNYESTFAIDSMNSNQTVGDIHLIASLSVWKIPWGNYKTSVENKKIGEKTATESYRFGF